MNIPQVRIKYAWLLANSASVVMNEKWGDGTPLRSFKEYEKVAAKYEKWWRPYNDQVLEGICEILGLEFRQNIIDVNVAPWFSPISDPMTIGPAFTTADNLVDTMAHEMLHRLITDNTTYPYDYDFLTQWRAMFGDEHAQNTLIHIPVHAAMEALYIKLDRPDLLALDLEQTKEYKEYKDAWTYVRKVGYKEVV
ncbi:MAG TPA: hypothetical protein PKD68_05180, partial [Candidatus Saccharibacteria bacterium]|nr:hypothetical protein [Candidatus Saccharibacteria bacterium]